MLAKQRSMLEQSVGEVKSDLEMQHYFQDVHIENLASNLGTELQVEQEAFRKDLVERIIHSSLNLRNDLSAQQKALSVNLRAELQEKRKVLRQESSERNKTLRSLFAGLQEENRNLGDLERVRPR